MLSGTSMGSGAPRRPGGQESVNFADPTAKFFMLTRIVAATQEDDQSMLKQLGRAGVGADVLERLRGMPLGEVWRFVAGDCGMRLTVDVTAMRMHLMRLDASKAERETMEYLVRYGASVSLLCQLYAMTPTHVRMTRKGLMSASTQGGRPRAPSPQECKDMVTRWGDLVKGEPCPRMRMRRLHEQFSAWPISSLESVVLNRPEWVALLGAARAPNR